jgi:acyl-CoA synthetase (AMP-forming)/AMP-acid ligase II
MIQVIDNDTGVKLGANQVGEICVKSPFMLTEYLNIPEVRSRFIHQMFSLVAKFYLFFLFG